MAADITSHGYPGTIAPGSVWARMQYLMGDRYGVYDQDALRVTAVETGGVQISPGSSGEFWGWGVYDKLNAPALVPIPVQTQPEVWFLIMARRTWGVVNKTDFVAIQCGSRPVYPLARNTNPGVIDDQPIAFVSVQAGSSVPTQIVDVRAIGTSPNDKLILDELALGYLAFAGMRCRLGTTEFSRILNAEGTAHVWHIAPGPWGRVDLTAVTTPLGSSQSGWTTSSGLPAPNQFLVNRLIRDGNSVEYTFRTRRIGGHVPVVDGSATDNLMFILNTAWRPDDVVYGTALYINTDGSNSGGVATLHPNGHITFVTGSGNRYLASKSSGYSLAATFNYTQSRRN